MSFVADILQRIKEEKELIVVCETPEEMMYHLGRIEAYQCVLQSIDQHFSTEEHQ